MKILYFVLRMLVKLNSIYDKMKEPKRFFVGILFVMFPFAIFYVNFEICACVWITIIIAIRIWWIHGNLKKYLR